MNEVSAAPKRPGVFDTGVRLTKEYVRQGAAFWGISPRTMVAILAMPFIIAGMGATSALLGKEAYKWFTSEDGFAESVQVIFYSLSLILSLIIARRRLRSGERLIPFLFLGLSLAFLFMIGEETSWGQRIFGWQTADSLAAVNKQDETNLHNIYGVGSTFKWIQLLVGFYGAIPALILWRWPGPERWRSLLGAVIPHHTLVLYFLPMLIWRTFRNLMEVPDDFYFVVAEYNEVIELILSLGFVLFLVFQLRQHAASLRNGAAPQAAEREGL